MCICGFGPGPLVSMVVLVLLFKKFNHILFLCLKHAISFTVLQNKSASDIEYRYLKILPLFDLDAVCRKMWSSMHTSLDIEYVVYMLCVHIGEFIIERRATIG